MLFYMLTSRTFVSFKRGVQLFEVYVYVRPSSLEGHVSRSRPLSLEQCVDHGFSVEVLKVVVQGRVPRSRPLSLEQGVDHSFSIEVLRSWSKVVFQGHVL